LTCGSPVRASEATDVLRTKLAKVLANKSDAAELGGVIDSIVVYCTLASKCLEDLPGLKGSGREEFKRLLVDLTRASLLWQLLRLRGAEVKLGVDMRDGNSYVAKSVVEVNVESVDVDWVVVKEGGDWWLADVVTDAASMVRTWRRSFKSTYDKGGWNAFVRKMRTVAERAEATHGG
jgi:hypothetical protein